MRRKRLFSVALAILLSAASAARAGAPNPQQLRDLFLLEMEFRKQYQAKDYGKASDACRKMVSLFPTQPGPHYNLACCLALLGKAEEAISALQAAVQNGYKGVDHLRTDEDLAGLREDKRFAECVKKVNENERGTGAAYEAGSEIEGVKTLEADPEAGFRYRLRMSPTATAKKPNRLILWLHPSGGSGNQMVEPWSKRLNSLGYALLVLTQKDWRFWSPLDMNRVLEGTLADVAKTPGIDAERPILMGFSAGGQVALSMWAATPGKFGALVLDAAYPVRPKLGGGFDTMPLPENIGIQQTPIFVLVGDQDGGSKVWQQIEPSWRQVGVPLTVYYIAGKAHGWLFGDKELTDLCAWLGQVRAGKLPSGTPPVAEPKAKEEPKKKK